MNYQLYVGRTQIIVKASAGRDDLGGRLYDEALVNFCVNKWMAANRITKDPRDNPKAFSRLIQTASKTKQVLSTVPDANYHMYV